MSTGWQTHTVRVGSSTYEFEWHTVYRQARSTEFTGIVNASNVEEARKKIMEILEERG